MLLDSGGAWKRRSSWSFCFSFFCSTYTSVCLKPPLIISLRTSFSPLRTSFLHLACSQRGSIKLTMVPSSTVPLRSRVRLRRSIRVTTGMADHPRPLTTGMASRIRQTSKRWSNSATMGCTSLREQSDVEMASRVSLGCTSLREQSNDKDKHCDHLYNMTAQPSHSPST